MLLRRLIVMASAMALLGAFAAAAPASGPSHAAGALAAKKAKKAKKKCPKGYKLRTVKKNGKKVKRCRKVKTKSGGGGGAPPAPPAGLFEAPGVRLEGEAAKPFLQKYLLNSTFTDCPAGWPSCAVEHRYSHAADASFYHCRLTPSSGSDIRFGSEYQVLNAVVEADGSWRFNELVPSGGSPSHYEWHVAANGVVTGAYSFDGGPVEQLGPFQYMSGARDCSY